MSREELEKLQNAVSVHGILSQVTKDITYLSHLEASSDLNAVYAVESRSKTIVKSHRKRAKRKQ